MAFIQKIKETPYVTSLSLLCATGTSVIVPPLRVSYYAVGFLHHSLFRKDKKHSDRTTSKFAARN